MTKAKKAVLNELSKEQLIYLIEQFYHSQFLIGEVCVAESKQHIDSGDAVDEIRDCLYDIPNMNNVIELKSYIDMKMGKITIAEFRKIMGLDE